MLSETERGLGRFCKRLKENKNPPDSYSERFGPSQCRKATMLFLLFVVLGCGGCFFWGGDLFQIVWKRYPVFAIVAFSELKTPGLMPT